jgi:HD-GYP domain-containing protein (c-di-GMP phosphodiesterase class II)/DNA-binding CsgD family transcriptional regulator
LRLTQIAELRLAELLAGLSLVTDLAARHPSEQALRACILASHLAEQMGLGDEEASHAYYTTMLRFVGCTAPMPEYAASMGVADTDMRPRGDMTDMTNPKEAFSLIFSLGSSLPAWRRPAVWAGVMLRGRAAAPAGVRADCDVAARMARRFNLHENVATALYQTFERWDGHGLPSGMAGEAIALPARVAGVAFAAVMFHDAGGREAAVDALRRWSGRGLDPEIAASFLRRSDELLGTVESEDAWLDALACEPAPKQLVPERLLDEVIRGFGDFVDLKSTYLHGHSAGVAALAEAAGRACNLSETDTIALRRAGWLHDLGRAAVPTVVWEKPGPLTMAEWEQVRLHPYHTERMLSRSSALAPLAQLAGMHHERIDGSGYHRGALAAAQSRAARILAAADVYQALTEERPHRAALSPEAAARVIEAQPGLDRDAVTAVLQAVGRRAGRKRLPWPAGLSDREVEVLRLLARGRSMRKIADALFISPSTVHTHVAHIYEKAGITTRASAALFAMENGLLES